MNTSDEKLLKSIAKKCKCKTTGELLQKMNQLTEDVRKINCQEIYGSVKRSFVVELDPESEKMLDRASPEEEKMLKVAS